ncbi:MAG: DUF3450 domain-containing protein [Pseudomonadota bacterium]
MKFGQSAAAAALLSAIAIAPAHAQLREAINTSQQTANQSAASQERINTIDEQTEALVREFRDALKQYERLTRYNESLERQVEAQEREIVQLRTDIDEVANLQRDIFPMIEDMLSAISRFVEADMPFLRTERMGRVERLNTLLDDANATAAQKYRSLMEAFAIENEYGRTIEAYEDVLIGNTEGKRVDYLRIGRVILIYKAKDDSEMGVWDRTAGKWIPLDSSYLQSVKTGIRMANEQIPPDLLPIPTPAPEAVE